MAFSDIGDLLDEDGDLKPLSELTPAQRGAIASTNVVMKNATAGGGKIDRVLKVKLWDKVKALELQMKHFWSRRRG